MTWSVAVSATKDELRDSLAAPSELTGSRETTSPAFRSEYLTTEPGLGELIEECIVKCLDCQSICMKVVDHYLRLRNVKSECAHVRSLLNCSEICATAARFMLRGSEFCRDLCRFCAEVCKSCAGQISGVGDEAEMEACAAACRRCAECCERIAGVGILGSVVLPSIQASTQPIGN